MLKFYHLAFCPVRANNPLRQNKDRVLRFEELATLVINGNIKLLK
jgi:hypothetical protein